MTTFGCPECGRNWQEGPTRDYTEYYMCRKCIEALARKAGEALADLANLAENAMIAANKDGAEFDIDGELEAACVSIAKLRAAEILKGGE